MLQVLNDILASNAYCWTVVAVMSMVFAGFVCSTVGNALYFMVFFPAFILGGLTGAYAFRLGEIELLPDRQLSFIVESAIGMMATLVVLLLIARTMMALKGLTIRPTRTGQRVRGIIVPR